MKRLLLILGLAVGLVASAQTRLVVNVGNSSNDGAGDSVRTAFQKFNTNFLTLWTTVYTNGTGGGGGTNYLFDTNWFSVSGTNVTLKPHIYLTNNWQIEGGQAGAVANGIRFYPLKDFYAGATNLSLVGYSAGLLNAPTVTVWSPTEFDLITPAVDGATATVGQYLKLINASTGKAEWATAAFLPLAGGTMTGAVNAGGYTLSNLGAPSSANDAATKTYVDSAAPGIVTNLRAWTQSAAYQLTSATYDSDNVLSSATVTWPDGSSGTFTRTAKNATFLVVDAFTITHATSGKTVTQSTVTRNANGSITTQPALSVAP